MLTLNKQLLGGENKAAAAEQPLLDPQRQGEAGNAGDRRSGQPAGSG